MENDNKEITGLDDVGVLATPLNPKEQAFASLTIQSARRFARENSKTISDLTNEEMDLCMIEAVKQAKKENIHIPKFYFKYFKYL